MDLEGLSVENWQSSGEWKGKGWVDSGRQAGEGGGGQCWGRGVGSEGDSVGGPARGTAQGVPGTRVAGEGVDLKGQFFTSSSA